MGNINIPRILISTEIASYLAPVGGTLMWSFNRALARVRLDAGGTSRGRITAATSRCLWTTVDEAPVWPGCRRPEPLRAAAEAGPGAGGAVTAGASVC